MAPSAGFVIILIFFGNTVKGDQDLDLDNDNLMDVKISENKEHDVLGKHQILMKFLSLLFFSLSSLDIFMLIKTHLIIPIQMSI